MDNNFSYLCLTKLLYLFFKNLYDVTEEKLRKSVQAEFVCLPFSIYYKMKEKLGLKIEKKHFFQFCFDYNMFLE